MRTTQGCTLVAHPFVQTPDNQRSAQPFCLWSREERNLMKFVRKVSIIGLALLMQIAPRAIAQDAETTITIDARAATTPFPHFWEQTFGSGRAVLALRESYRKDLRAVKAATGFEAVRFHGIFDDEVGLYDPGRQSVKFAQMANSSTAAPDGAGIYNFSYIDQIYDGLLENGVRPFIEMSFMPKKLASDPKAIHPFWYHPNVSPPSDYAKWDAMITAFAQHLIARYGIEEVSHWKFEVWNEPNLDFWGGKPKQESYFKLYDHTARALKAVSSRIQVGGPSTAQAAWVGEFLSHCKNNNVPVDFASTHVYGNDSVPDVFHRTGQIPRDKLVCMAVKKVHEEIVSSPFPHMPLIWSEYNASYANEPNVTDTAYMGPWMATTISQCDGLVQSMSYWSFSDVFEEQGVVRTPFYGGFGLMAEDSIPKPALNAFAALHELGDQRIRIDSDDAIATKTADGSIVAALWNYAPPDGIGATYTPRPSTPRSKIDFTVQVQGVAKNAAVTLWRVDEDHGNVIKEFDRMGRPAAPSRDQIRTLQQAGKASAPELTHLTGGVISISVPQHGLVVLRVETGKHAKYR